MTLRFIIYLLLILAGIITGLYYYKRIGTAYKLLTQMLILIFVSELAGRLFLGQLKTTYPFYHVLQVFQILYYGGIFYFLLRPTKFKNLIIITTLVLAIITVCISIFYQSVFTFPSIGSQILNLYVVLLSLGLFNKMIKNPIAIPILRQSSFWFASGSLFFHAITFLVFGYFKLFQESSFNTPVWVYELIRIANYILYASYFLCLVFAKNTKNS